MANNSVSNPTFKPRRGSYSSMHNSNIVLEEGELFVETPDLGPGRGAMKMKMGDGVSDYDTLPYGLGDNTTTLTVDIVEDSSTTTAEALAKLTTGKTVGEYTGLFKKIDELEKSDLDTYKNSLDRSDKTSNVTADSSATAEAAEANVVNGKKLSEHIGSLKQAATKNTGSIRTLEKLISNDSFGVYITGDSTVTTNRDLKAKATTNIDIGNNNYTGGYTKPDIVIGLSNNIRDESSNSVGYNTVFGYNNSSGYYSESYNTIIGYNNSIKNADYSTTGGSQYSKNTVIGNNNKTSSGNTSKDIIIGNDNDLEYAGSGGSILLGNSLKSQPGSGSSEFGRNPILIGSDINLRTSSSGQNNVVIGKRISDGYHSYYYGDNDFIALGFDITTPYDGPNGIYIGSGIDFGDTDTSSSMHVTTKNTIIGSRVKVEEKCTNNILISSPNSSTKYIGDRSNHYISNAVLLTTASIDYKSYMGSDMVYLSAGYSQPSDSMSGSGCRFMFASGGTSYLEINGNDMWIRGTLHSSSDATLKNIKDEPVPDVSSIKAVQFEWNEKANAEDNHAIHTGYIAQDVEAVAPQYVTTNEEGIKSLSYIELLVAKVDNLEKRLEQMNQLENKVNSLEKKVAELEAKLSEKENN